MKELSPEQPGREHMTNPYGLPEELVRKGIPNQLNLRGMARETIAWRVITVSARSYIDYALGNVPELERLDDLASHLDQKLDDAAQKLCADPTRQNLVTWHTTKMRRELFKDWVLLLEEGCAVPVLDRNLMPRENPGYEANRQVICSEFQQEIREIKPAG